ncbi:hypothetical protein CEXT_641081 [Caerostris extrusa]|uniref:Uncharacterized protein n=1 Tax=Caerostris extrusa TaxID=172846 RepID=A0AAV4N6T9_CAEEX|nr:hypothetical protein CEXT_641081 [Caerostris extrusa]
MLCMETDDIEGTDLFRSTPKYPRSLLFPTSPEMLSNLTDEERCARISRLLMKKDIAQVSWILLMLQPLAMHLMRMIVSS